MSISSPNILLVFIFELFCLWWSIVYYCLSAMPGGINFGKPRCESWCSIRSKPNSCEDINSDHCNSWFFFRLPLFLTEIVNDLQISILACMNGITLSSRMIWNILQARKGLRPISAWRGFQEFHGLVLTCFDIIILQYILVWLKFCVFRTVGMWPRT